MGWFAGTASKGTGSLAGGLNELGSDAGGSSGWGWLVGDTAAGGMRGWSWPTTAGCKGVVSASGVPRTTSLTISSSGVTTGGPQSIASLSSGGICGASGGIWGASSSGATRGAETSSFGGAIPGGSRGDWSALVSMDSGSSSAAFCTSISSLRMPARSCNLPVSGSSRGATAGAAGGKPIDGADPPMGAASTSGGVAVSWGAALASSLGVRVGVASGSLEVMMGASGGLASAHSLGVTSGGATSGSVTMEASGGMASESSPEATSSGAISRSLLGATTGAPGGAPSESSLGATSGGVTSWPSLGGVGSLAAMGIAGRMLCSVDSCGRA